MYDLDHLKQCLPYCTKIDFEVHSEPGGGVRFVVVECHYVGGLEARAECHEMPPTTEKLAELVAAGAQQCLSDLVQAATFSVGTKMRKIERDERDPSKAHASGPRLPVVPPQAPSLREVMTTMPDVIDVDGTEVTSTAIHKKSEKALYDGGRRAYPALTDNQTNQPVTKALPPPVGALDRDKAKRATEAMGNLLRSIEDDD